MEAGSCGSGTVEADYGQNLHQPEAGNSAGPILQCQNPLLMDYNNI